MTGKNRRPSLLWVNHFAVLPQHGGGTRHFEMGRELVRRGWRVSIAASDLHLQTRTYTRRADARSRDLIRESVEGVDFLWLWAASYRRNNWRRGLNWLTFSRSLLAWRPSAEEAPEVVIGSSPHLFAALAAERLARRLRVPFVFEVRDLWPEGLLAAGGRRGPAYHLMDRIARHLYRRADRVIVLARGSVRHLAERGVDAGKLVYVPNGVDLSQFPPAQRNGDDRFTLVYAGAHGPVNGLGTVLDAAELLRDRSRVRFLLVGDGPVKEELVRSARQRGLDNVEFRDAVPKQEMPRVLAEADAGLMVLRDDPLFAFGVSPNKLFDYLGAGLPVVCNVPGEVEEALRAAGAGEQARDVSGAALAEAVLRLEARSHAEREEIGRAGRDWVAREHGRQLLADRLEAAIRPLLPA